jgi:hypothetical protein
MQVNCGDIRFLDSNDTNLSYWIESGCNTSNTLIWVKVPSIPANSQIVIRMTYKGANAGMTTGSSLSNTIPVLALSNNKLWLAANRGIDVDSSNNVTAWADQSGNGNNATQFVGQTYPVYSNNVNNKPSVNFTNDALRVPYSPSLGFSNNTASIFTVMRSPQVQDRNYAYVFTNKETEGISLQNDDNSGNAWLSYNGTNGDNFRNYSGLFNNNLNLFGFTIGNGNISQVLNGSVSNFTYSSHTPILSNGSSPFIIGNHINGYYGFDGDISEFLVFDTRLNASQIAEVQSYLNYKYRMYSTSSLVTYTVGTESSSTGAIINFGANQCTNVNIISATELTCIVPSTTSAGFVNVSLSANGDTYTVNNGYEYVEEVLELNNISPKFGSKNGGTYVTLTGLGFQIPGTLSVTIDSLPCTNVNVLSETQITCQTPASTTLKTADVKVQIDSNQSILNQAFTYTEPVTLENISLYYDANHPSSYNNTNDQVFDLVGNNHGSLGMSLTTEGDEPTFVTNPIKYFDFNTGNRLKTGLQNNFSASFTQEIWIKRSSLLLDTETILTGNNKLQIKDRKFQDLYQSGSTSNTQDSGFYAGTDWQMITRTYNTSTFENKIYINGVLHSTYIAQLDTPSLDYFVLGGENSFNFLGGIASLRVYQTALTPSQITHNFNTEKAKFGYTQTVPEVGLPISISFNNKETNRNQETASLNLSSLEIIDKRESFTNYTITARVTDMTSSNATGAISTIPANKISIEPNYEQLELLMGSGLNTQINNFVRFNSASMPVTIFSSNGPTGGGRFRLNPRINIDIPGFTKAGLYTGTLTVDVL